MPNVDPDYDSDSDCEDLQWSSENVTRICNECLGSQININQYVCYKREHEKSYFKPPLMVAIESNFLKAVELLIKSGA